MSELVACCIDTSCFWSSDRAQSCKAPGLLLLPSLLSMLWRPRARSTTGPPPLPPTPPSTLKSSEGPSPSSAAGNSEAPGEAPEGTPEAGRRGGEEAAEEPPLPEAPPEETEPSDEADLLLSVAPLIGLFTPSHPSSSPLCRRHCPALSLVQLPAAGLPLRKLAASLPGMLLRRPPPGDRCIGPWNSICQSLHCEPSRCASCAPVSLGFSSPTLCARFSIACASLPLKLASEPLRANPRAGDGDGGEPPGASSDGPATQAAAAVAVAPAAASVFEDGGAFSTGTTALDEELLPEVKSRAPEACCTPSSLTPRASSRTLSALLWRGFRGGFGGLSDAPGMLAPSPPPAAAAAAVGPGGPRRNGSGAPRAEPTREPLRGRSASQGPAPASLSKLVATDPPTEAGEPAWVTEEALVPPLLRVGSGGKGLPAMPC